MFHCFRQSFYIYSLNVDPLDHSMGLDGHFLSISGANMNCELLLIFVKNDAWLTRDMRRLQTHEIDTTSWCSERNSKSDWKIRKWNAGIINYGRGSVSEARVTWQGDVTCRLQRRVCSLLNYGHNWDMIYAILSICHVAHMLPIFDHIYGALSIILIF